MSCWSRCSFQAMCHAYIASCHSSKSPPPWLHGHEVFRIRNHTSTSAIPDAVTSTVVPRAVRDYELPLGWWCWAKFGPPLRFSEFLGGRDAVSSCALSPSSPLENLLARNAYLPPGHLEAMRTDISIMHLNTKPAVIPQVKYINCHSDDNLSMFVATLLQNQGRPWRH